MLIVLRMTEVPDYDYSSKIYNTHRYTLHKGLDDFRLYQRGITGVSMLVACQGASKTIALNIGPEKVVQIIYAKYSEDRNR